MCVLNKIKLCAVTHLCQKRIMTLMWVDALEPFSYRYLGFFFLEASCKILYFSVQSSDIIQVAMVMNKNILNRHLNCRKAENHCDVSAVVQSLQRKV